MNSAKTARFRRRLRQGIRHAKSSLRINPFPLRNALRGYRLPEARRDLKTGTNVALLAFPQGMAYATIAGLPIEYGVYGAAVASFVGPLFSGSRFVVLGPTNATSILLFTSLLSLNVTAAEKVTFVPVLLVMAGAFLVLGAIFRASRLIQYVSQSVITGYIAAAALFIVLNQVRKVVGVEFDVPVGTTLFGMTRLTIENLPGAGVLSICLSVVTAIVFVFLQRKFRALPNVALSLIIASLVALVLNRLFAAGWPGRGMDASIRMLYPIDTSQWLLQAPRMDSVAVSNLAVSALILAFLCILEGSSIGKSLASRSGKRFDTDQEMFGMGMANIACAFSSGMPASGSLSRSKLNFAGDAGSPMASIFSGIICALIAVFLGSYIAYIPEAALGVVIISIGVSLINRYDIRVVVKTTRSDAIVFATTFASALFIKLEFGIIFGTVTSVLLFLRKAAVPELVEYTVEGGGHLIPLGSGKSRPDPEVSIVHVEGELFFGAAELFRNQMRRLVEDANLKVVVLKMRNARHLDATSVFALMELVRNMRKIGRHLLVSEARNEVIRVFRNSGLIEVIGRENIFPDVTHNPTLSTARALRRAKDLVGGVSTQVRIFTSKNRAGRSSE